MKILELYLKAYGPFTERRIVLDSPRNGLHVVFGRNEAGKSSALRAIDHLLYGIPLRTTDDFLHEYASMRIGGRLRHSDGREIAFLRKKGSKNTLRSWDDADALEDSALAPFLLGVPDELFRSFFGIDHEILIAGGQSLLEDEGDVGRSLFAAGLGSGNLRTVLSGFEDEAKALFVARGSKPSINALLAQLREIKKAIKEGALKPREWQEHDRALSKADTELQGVDRQLQEAREDASRLDRLGNALKFLTRRRSRLDAIEARGEVTPLAEDFEERLRTAREQGRSAKEELTRARQALDDLRAKLSDLRLDPSLLDQRDVVENLRERLGSYKAARSDLPRREGERNGLGEEVAAVLSTLGVRADEESIDTLRAPLGRRRQIQELASAHTKLQTLLETASKALRKGSQKREEASSELAALPPARVTDGLERALRAALNLGDVDEQVKDLRLRRDEIQRDCEDQLASLGLWTGSLEELERTAVPTMETIERFQASLDELERKRESTQGLRSRAEDEIRATAAQLDALRRGGSVPSEADLADERERRDAAWRLVRRSWVEGEEIDDEIAAFSGSAPLPEVYERHIASADEVADRLRLDADRVASQAELLSRRLGAEQNVEECDASMERIREDWTTLDQEWRTAWRDAGIEPLPPREMLAWLRRQQRLLEAASDGRGKQNELNALEQSRTDRCVRLLAELHSLDESGGKDGEELADVVACADDVLQAIESETNQRGTLRAAIEEADRSLTSAREDERDARERLQGWREEWTVTVDGLGITESARPSEALDRLDSVGAVFGILRDIQSLDGRIDAMNDDLRAFEGEVGEFVSNHAPVLVDQPLEQAVERLGRVLSKVDKEEIQRVNLRERIQAEENAVREAERKIETANESLATLRGEAGCADDSALDEALRAWQALQDDQAKIEEIEEHLKEISARTSIAQLEHEAGEIDRDELEGRRAGLEDKIRELEERRTELLEMRATARAELEHMDGSARVAAAAEDEQEVLALLRRDVQRYMALRLAKAILEREIEHYRREHQAPLLLRARELFRKLTLGAYESLQTDYDEDDVPRLVGVREDDRKVGVDGMSSGTRDQLFLALRLASLEEYLMRSEPMPFIADDILVNFDSDRSRATLQVLADLGERTQVLLFTHHDHIREYAEELGGRASVLNLGDI